MMYRHPQSRASQGLTAEVSLLYGHGSNAHAPGHHSRHIWLPPQVVEDEQTQARLGAARSKTEGLQRAVTAFAKFLGQDRGNAMVSDLTGASPAERPAHREHQEARRASEEAVQQARRKVSVRRPGPAAASSP
ncbi:hypothetical protein ACFVW1_20985 [Streptomyces olivochromogenes]|uniref:hypothetical protein n=1 Tax=Streptomyces olivochromogenes TaxID=1963 RepID=UPI0036D8F149